MRGSSPRRCGTALAHALAGLVLPLALACGPAAEPPAAGTTAGTPAGDERAVDTTADARAPAAGGPAPAPPTLRYDAENPLTRPPAPALPPLPPEGETLRIGPPLVIASDLDHYPFIYRDERGQPAGRDVEMMDAIGRMLGRPNTWVTMPFEAIVDAVARGEASVGCATIGWLPERAERVLYTRAYFDTSLAVLVRAGEGEPVALADLAGRRVLAAAGTTAAAAVRERLPQARLVTEAKAGSQPVERLLAGEVDALVEDDPDARRHALEHEGLAVLDEPLGSESYHLVVAPGQTALRQRLDELLDHLDARGDLEHFSRRHHVVPR